jgi:hypothetical protein
MGSRSRRWAAIRRASSSARLALGSQTRFSFFNGRYGSPAALPITAPFFFETETAGLMFVRHRWAQSFPWWLFCRFPREDAAADHECEHGRNKNPKLHLLHCGALRRATPPRAIIDLPAHQVLRTNSGSLAILAAIYFLHGQAFAMASLAKSLKSSFCRSGRTSI